MPSQCSVPMCNTVGGHKFPRDSIRSEQWVAAIRMGDYYKPTTSSVVCKKHFLHTDYVLHPRTQRATHFLKKDAVPSQFSWNSSQSQKHWDYRLARIRMNKKNSSFEDNTLKRSHSFDEKENKTENNAIEMNATHKAEDSLKLRKIDELVINSNEMTDTLHGQATYADDGTGRACEVISECRACLQQLQPEGLFSLFQGWAPAWQGLGSSIAEDLLGLADIQLSETDKHSHYICYNCCEKLWHARHFKLLVQHSDEVLRRRSEEWEKVWPKPIQVDKNLNGLIDPYSSVDIKEEVMTDDELPNSDDVTDSFNILDIKVEPEEIVEQAPIIYNGVTPINQFPVIESTTITAQGSKAIVNGEANTENEVLQPVKEEPPSDPEDLELAPECLLCSRTFHSVRGLKAHVIANHSYQTVGRKSEVSQKTGEKHVCAICRRSFATSTDLLVHETCHNKHSCYACGVKCETFAALSRHRRRCRPKDTTEGMKRPKTLEDVIRPHMEENKQNEQDSIENQVVKPEKKEGSPPKDCDSLGVNNRKHEETELAPKFSCPLCNDTFNSIYYVQIHQEVHHYNEKTDLREVKEPVPMKVETLEDIFDEET